MFPAQQLRNCASQLQSITALWLIIIILLGDRGTCNCSSDTLADIISSSRNSHIVDLITEVGYLPYLFFKKHRTLLTSRFSTLSIVGDSFEIGIDVGNRAIALSCTICELFDVE